MEASDCQCPSYGVASCADEGDSLLCEAGCSFLAWWEIAFEEGVKDCCFGGGGFGTFVADVFD